MAKRPARRALKSLSELQGRLDEIAGQIVDGVEEWRGRVALEVQTATAAGTPVDTAQARSNWLLSPGRARLVPIRPYLPYPSFWKTGRLGPGMRERRNLEAVRQQGAAAVGRSREGVPIYITNPLPYIKRLNDGHSLQNSNFVAKGIALGVNKARPLLPRILKRRLK